MKITKYPQSCFLFETKGVKILIDPGNLVDEKDIGSFENIDVILYTHTHNDHCFPEYTGKILKNNNPKIYGNSEVVKKLKNFGVKKVKQGDKINLDEIKIEVQGGVHGYLPGMKDKPLPVVNGFVIDDGEKRIYHCGDTISFYNPIKVDICLVPVCGHGVVMESDVAIEFTFEMVGADLIIPMHYESPKHPLGSEKFEKVAKNEGINYKILRNGEVVEV